jgi:hypothetical protein
MSSAITRSITARPRSVAWREVQGMRVAHHNKDEPTPLDWSDVLAWTRDRCARPGVAKFLVDYERFVAVIGELRSELAASAEASQRPIANA